MKNTTVAVSKLYINLIILYVCYFSYQSNSINSVCTKVSIYLDAHFCELQNSVLKTFLVGPSSFFFQVFTD